MNLKMYVTGDILSASTASFNITKGTWVTYNPQVVVALDSTSAGTKAVIVRYKDEVSNISEASMNIWFSSPPIMAGVTINNGEAATTQSLITVYFSASDNDGVVSMYLRGDIDTANTAITFNQWIPYQTTITASLSSGDSKKFVYVTYKDSIGSTTNELSAWIAYNTAAPILGTQPTGPVTITSDPTLQVGIGDDVTALLNATTNTLASTNVVILIGENPNVISADIESVAVILGGVSDPSGTATKNIINKDQYVSIGNLTIAGWMPSTNVGSIIQLFADTSAIAPTASGKLAIMAVANLISLGSATVNSSGTFKIISTQQLTEGVHNLLITATNTNGSVTGCMRIVVDYSAPLISLFTIDGQRKVSGDVVDTHPVVEATITDNYSAISTSSISILLDDGLPSMVSYNWQTSSPNMSFTGGIFKFTIPSILSATITHNLTFIVNDVAATTNVSIIQLNNLRVIAGVVTVLNGPAFNPNPFNPMSINSNYQTSRIAYELSESADLQVNIYNMRGESIWRRSFSSGTLGARSGYNEVFWNGTNDYGELCGNGVYIVQLVNGSRLLAKGKVVILK